MLVRCLYASRAATDPAGASSLDEILRQCRKNNPVRGITGILCFCETSMTYVQALEGSRAEISGLLGKLFRDGRHTDMQILSLQECGERQFSQWTMGLIKAQKMNPQLMLKYSDKPVLDPYSVSAEATLALMREIAATGAIANRTT